MARLTMKAIQDSAKSQIFANILELANEQGGIQFGNFDVALPVNVDTGEGVQEVFVTVTLTAKNWKDTKQSDAFNPYEEREEWLADLEYKAKLEKAKAEAKAKGKSKSKSDKA